MSSTPKDPQQVILDTQKSLIINLLKENENSKPESGILSDSGGKEYLDRKEYLQKINLAIVSAMQQFMEIARYELASKRDSSQSRLKTMWENIEKNTKIIESLFKGIEKISNDLGNTGIEKNKIVAKETEDTVKSLKIAIDTLTEAFNKIPKPSVPEPKSESAQRQPAKTSVYGYNPKTTTPLRKQIADKSSPKKPAPKTSTPPEKPRWR